MRKFIDSLDKFISRSLSQAILVGLLIVIVGIISGLLLRPAKVVVSAGT